jgi:hypothetical protein
MAQAEKSTFSEIARVEAELSFMRVLSRVRDRREGDVGARIEQVTYPRAGAYE